MKIDFDTKFEGLEGDEAETLTLAVVAATCLNFVNPASREALPLDKAVKRGNLSLQLKKGGQQDLDIEDISLIRSTLSTLLYKPFIIAQAAGLLDVPKE